jgi:hypothetical protein
MQTSYELFAANGTTVLTYGCIALNFDLGLRRDFSWRFVVAYVTGSIIGSDFFSFYNLLVDMRHRRLIDSITHLKANGASVGTDGAGSSRYHALLQEFPDIIRAVGVLQSTVYSPSHPHHAWATCNFPSTAASTGSPSDRKIRV